MDKSLKPSLLAIALIAGISTIPLQTWRSQAEGLSQRPATRMNLARAGGLLLAQGTVNPGGSLKTSQPSAQLALSNDGQLIVRGTEAGQLEWLDPQGKILNTVKAAHGAAVSGVVLTPDGQTVISTGLDGTLRRWSRTGKPLGQPIVGRGGAILALALSPDGQTLVIGNQKGTIERWSVADGTALSPVLAADNSPIQTIHYSEDGKNFFTGSGDGSLARWSAQGGLLKQVDSAHQGAITVIIPSPYGKVITSGGADGVIRSWDQATLLPQGKPISAHRAAVTAIAYSPNGTTVATAGADKTLRLWGGDGMALPSVSPDLSSPASFLGFTPAGQLLVGTADHRLEIRDSRPDGEAQPSPANPSNSLSPDGDLWGRIQSLPPNTWWILLAVPGGLFLLGLLGAFLGTKRQPEVGNQSASPDLPSGAVPSQPLPGAEMGIDFSGIGQKPSVDQALSLPPEASLIPPTAAVAEPASPGQLEQARSQLVEGKRLMREQRCDLALIHFNSAIEATELERLNTTASGAPISGVNVIAAQAQAHRGNALLQMEQLAEAMESYNIALGFDTTNLEAWLGKGRLLTKLERYEEALFCFDSALELDKTAIAAWSGKAEVLMQLGRQAEAQTCVDRVVSLGGEFSRPLPLITGPITTGLVPDPPIDVTPPATAGLPSVSPAYDPDVPMELQQMVQVLPSGDSGSSPAITPTILPDLGTVALLPDQGDIPEALTAAVAQLPDQGDIPEALTAAVAQLPDQGDIPEALTAAVAQLPDQGDIPEALTAAVAQLPDQADIPEALTAAVAQLPDQADIPEALTAAVAQLPDQADVPEVLAAIGEASPPFPLSLEEQLLGQVSLSAVLPPTIQDSPSPEATEPGAPPLVQASDSPLEAAIENSSYDSSNQPSPTLSWVKLSIDQDRPDRFYAQWHIDDGDRTTARHQGGQTLALRLYDVTGQGTDTPLAGPVQEQRCDDLAQDWYLPIPQWDRIYLAAVGYVGDGDSWHTIAQSPELAAISG